MVSSGRSPDEANDDYEEHLLRSARRQQDAPHR
jgi:hypothetical protein